MYVPVTGAKGFKGTWLVLWLEKMGEFYRLLAKIVRKYFVYDAKTHKKKEGV